MFDLFWNSGSEVFIRDLDGNVAKLEGIKSISISESVESFGRKSAHIELEDFNLIMGSPPEKKSTDMPNKIPSRKMRVDK